MSNKLIDAFMHLHSTNSSNLFAEAKKAKKLDPVGKEDEDIDNDGDKDKSDSYLHNRRKAIKAAMKEAIDPHAEGMVKAGTKAPEMTTDPEYLKKKPAGGNSKVIQTGPNSSIVTKSTNEEVEFSEAELAHIAAILEANPVAPVPDDYSGAAGGVSKRDLSDETVAEEEMKRGRGRPKGSKSGSKHGAGGDSTVETKNLAAQIRFARPSGGNFSLKHPTTGETKSVPAKAATEFYSKYTAAEKPAQKQAHHDEFVAKHFGSSEKPKSSGISLAKMPAPKS